jgi:hypothetical protein
MSRFVLVYVPFRIHDLAAFAFFLFLIFCMFEIGYRSVELFLVVLNWGAAFRQNPDVSSNIFHSIMNFKQIVNALYFPLLLSQFVGSAIFAVIAYADKAGIFLVVAMALNSVRILSRLGGYWGMESLDVLNGIFFFIPLFLVNVLMIIWLLKFEESKESI